MFTLNSCEGEWIFPMVVNLVHESIFSYVEVMMLQDWDLSHDLWCVDQSSKLFWKGNDF